MEAMLISEKEALQLADYCMRLSEPLVVDVSDTEFIVYDIDFTKF